MGEWWQDFVDTFTRCFITDDRWKYIVRGLGVTLEVTVLALVLGVVLGVIVAAIRSSHDQQRGSLHGPGRVILAILNFICKIYITVIRGTPVMIQLMIMYFVILVNTRSMVLVAVMAFGINSGAYVAEIVRGGIMSVDMGQTEASHSLGLGYLPTMRFVVIPQAMKNILPALGNELISLLKETSIVTVIGLADLTRGANIILGATYEAFMPLIAAALIYLGMVVVLTWLLGKLERRLRQSDRR
jgi:His/Glu/Gln/Arg/opine family amino acid ABC transporter permease subunit